MRHIRINKAKVKNAQTELLSVSTSNSITHSIPLFTLTVIKQATFSFQSTINHIISITVHQTTHRVIRNDCRGFNNLSPRSPDTTPRDFFLWVYVKDQVYVPPLPASIPELKVRIRTATEIITGDMQQTVWNEIDYRVDVCRITKGAHIEHL